ncbi:unnamed protein product [Caenorhabditis bovis]|uniref:Uncharacterized protein n=1 Tax=Caenorhabditis bovis TaxID=2654633 RepID=A0A8S1F727_9PELO|nr:unnamed protein product [Caenorhabditis bovis]
MSNPKETLNYLNNLALQTIEDVEKLLLSLPTAGNKCELQVAKEVNTKNGRSTADVVARNGNFKVRDVPQAFSLSPPSSQNTRSCSSQTDSSSSHQIKDARKTDYRSIRSITKHLESREKSPESSEKKCNSSSTKTPVVLDKIRVSAMTEVIGVILELDVDVRIPEKNEKKMIKMEIECPNYVPNRVKIGNKWKKIV